MIDYCAPTRNTLIYSIKENSESFLGKATEPVIPVPMTDILAPQQINQNKIAQYALI